MKKIFTLSILFLLSVVATTSLASGKTDDAVKLKSVAVDGLISPEFSSDDNSNEIWYYIRFGRRANDNLVWTTDYPTNENSWAIKQLAQKTTDKTTQHWKLVGSEESFYIVNRATGFKVMYAEATDAEKGIRGTNYIVDATGGPGTNLLLAGSRDNRDATYWNWTGALDWVIINPALNAHAFMNDRGSNADFPWRDVCNYPWADDGFRIQFVYAERQTIVVAVDSFAIETPINHTGQGVFSGISNFNLTTGITATIEGDDASYFGFLDNNNTLPDGNGSLKITFAPTEIRTYNATLVLSGGTAESVRVRLIGTGFNISEMPSISSIDDSDEHWYYIQFYRKASANTVWSLRTDTTLMIVQDTLKGGIVRDDQQWKICGTWEGGFWFVNKTGVEMAYNITASEDGTKPASRYIKVALEAGDLFDFIRFKASGVSTDDWQLYNRSTTAGSKYVNEQGGKHLTNYSANDAGNRLIFIPADKPTIKVPVETVSIEAPVNESITSTLNITGLQTTAVINVAVSGADAAAFSVSSASLPVEGGVLSITFSPTEIRNYAAALTLSSAGADNLEIALTGNSDLGLPGVSTTGNEAWYYIQFSRNTAQVWSAVPGTEGRYDTKVMQMNKEDENPDQQWKFEGNWTDGYRIINRNGGAFFFDDVTTLRILLTEETAFGDLFKFERKNSTAQWELKVIGKADESNSYLNDYNGSQRDGSICLYSVNDAGNTLNFIAANGTGIEVPSFDPNDKVVAVKYYTLQGVEVRRPATTGVYIVRNVYASGKTKAKKQLFIIK